MKAVVFHDVGDVRLDDIPEPQIQKPTDAVVRITASAICGTDLHMVRGSMGPMLGGTVLGHEGVGFVEAVGSGVRNLKPGDRVVIPSSIACGYCSYCRAGYYSQCDNANPNGKLAGTAFFGGPQDTGPFQGLQAEKALVPFANVGPVRIPDQVTDDQALMLSDIFPTGYFGAELAEITPGDTVAVFGCGPVGLFSIASANLFKAGRILAVDRIPARLEAARNLGAEVIDFDKEDPVEVILELTGGIGVDRVIDAVGVDAHAAHQGPAAHRSAEHEQEFRQERDTIALHARPQGENWHPGEAPSQVLRWAVEAIDKAGTLAVVGVYPRKVSSFPIGTAMNKNLTIKMGNCDHRKYIPTLMGMVESGIVDPTKVISQVEPISSVINAYKEFDAGHNGWVKVELVPGM
ncbi:MAG: zinc-dependent alcohol dehydrogenase [Chitinispirillaceae bacterium]